MTVLAARSPAGAAGWPRAGRILAFAGAGHGRACALLLLIGLACYLPGLSSLQPMDRDEPRFAQATKQMLETGDFVDIRFQGEARHKKPVGIYWLQAAAVAGGEALGVADARRAIWLYRLPSLAGALATILLTYWAALAFLRREAAFLAAALTGASLMLAAEAHIAKTDAVLAACGTAALGALARAWLARGQGTPLPRAVPLAFWAGMALGILVKGPMVPLFAGLPALALALHARSGRWLLALRPGMGLALVLAVCAPWFLAIAWKSGGAFFGEAVGKDMLAKVGTAKERHGGPPGTYFLLFFATFWPAAPFAALAAPFAWGTRREAPTAFLLAWIVPAWLLLEAVPTKLPHYVLPLMPAVAILTLLAAEHGALDPRRRGARAVAALLVLVPVGLTLGLAYAAWSLDGALPLVALPLLLAACALAALGWRAFAAGAVRPALVLSVGAALALVPGVLGLAQRDLPALQVSPRLAALRDRMPCAAPRVGTLGYREPSLVFLTGTGLTLLDTADDARAFLAGGGCRLVFVEARAAPGFAPAATVIGRVDGFNINGGRRLAVTAYAATPEEPR